MKRREFLYRTILAAGATTVGRWPVRALAASSTSASPVQRMLTFAPHTLEPNGWALEKVDQEVSPFDVVRGAGRGMHAVTQNVNYRDSRGSFQLTTLDAPVVALGKRSPLNFSEQLPDLQHGVHINLFNNAWGTNYIQWAGGDWIYRFRLTVG